MDRRDEEALYLDTEALLKVRGDPSAHGLAMMLVFAIWSPSRQPFEYDPDAIFRRLQSMGQKGIKREDLDNHREGAKRFFVILEDGRWAPSPEFFSVTDGNPGGHVV
ncbi:hypothetical protein D3C71_1104070 [compost metagenome]